MQQPACNCPEYPLIQGSAALNKRRFETRKIAAGPLAHIAEDCTAGHHLMQCEACGQHWQRSPYARNGKPYFFKVSQPTTVEAWRQKPFVQPDVLFAWAGAMDRYLRSATFQEQPRACCEVGCGERAIRFSGLCAYHHVLNIGHPATPPGDYEWCAPYDPADYRITPELVKSLPGYRALHP